MALTAGRGLRRPGLRPHLVRDVARPAARRRHAPAGVRARPRARRTPTAALSRVPDVAASDAGRRSSARRSGRRPIRRRSTRHGRDALKRGHAARRRRHAGHGRRGRRHRPAVPRRARAAGGARRRHRLHRRRRADPRRRRARRWRASTASSRSTRRTCWPSSQPNVITGDLHDAPSRRAACSIRPIRRVSPSARSAATSPSAPADRARSSTARRAATCWRSRPCCRPARSSAPAAKTVKNVVGYALTRPAGRAPRARSRSSPRSRVRLVPLPAARRTLSARPIATDRRRRRAVGAIVAAGVVPATLELIDARLARRRGARTWAGRWRPPGTAALLLVEVDGGDAAGVDEDARLAAAACRATGATRRIVAADSRRSASAVWEARRELSYALRRLAPAQDQPRRRGAARPRAGAVRARRRAAPRVTACSSPRSATPATATSTST